MEPRRLIVVVTGANSGIGYATCCRLIEQLLHFNPPDASLLHSPNGIPNIISPYAGTTELTIVVACRNPVSGEQTCELLSKHAEDAVQRQQNRADDNGHAKKFLKGLKIDYLRLDLNSIDSVFSFTVEARQRYPYISHLILNAGRINAARIDYFILIKQTFAEGYIRSVTFPKNFIQVPSVVNKDGLGDIWQVNVFGHYCLFRRLEPLLRACPFGEARIEWTTSLDGFKHSFNPNDLQLLNTRDSYQPSKYQVNLACAALARLEETSPPKEGEAKLTHVSIHPGICSTNNTAGVLSDVMALAKTLGFYLARWMGSQNHPVKPFKGALSGTFAALTSKQVLDEIVWNPPRLIGTRTTFWGKEYAALDPWELEEHESNLLEKYIEDIYNGLPQVARSS